MQDCSVILIIIIIIIIIIISREMKTNSISKIEIPVSDKIRDLKLGKIVMC